MEDERLLLAEYQQYSEAFWRNEDAGERRITFFITLTTALMAAIVAVRTAKADIAPEEVRQIASAALIGAATFGLATFFRILQRDRVTDEYKAILRYLREQLRKRGTSLDEYDLPFRAPRHWVLRGGLAVTVALMNSFLLAVLTAQWIPPTWRWLVVPAIFLISFAAHAVGIAARKREEEEPSQTFRAGVGAVILNEAGRVLALERRDITGAWQLPQGGLRIGEAPLAAVKREIKEETGVDGDLHLLFAIDRLLAYELPRSHRSKKTGRGQVQYWFIFRYRGAEERITLGDNKEFRRWKWTTMQDLSSNVVAFKKPVYQELGGFLARELGRGT